MRLLHSLEAWDAPACVAAVGNFDGVHLAHQSLLRAALHEARALGMPAVGVSFEPHPTRILAPQAAPPLLTPGEEKIRCLAATGLDALVLLPFSRDLSLLSPRAFVTQILVRGLRIRALHEGENFRFGHRQKGTMATLERLGREFHFGVHPHPVVRVRGEVVSSSRIRSLVSAGDVARARWLLGRPFAVRGLVTAGRGVGRQQTVPTLNLEPYPELLPAHGVYCTCVEVGGHRLPALTNVGVRPTFGPGGAVTVESHLLEPPPAALQAALEQPITVHFLHRVRDERRFESPQALRAQIELDIVHAGVFFRRLPARR